MKKILILGCSWGCGEWDVEKHNILKISHPGISEYLSSDYSVINLSRGGASNWQICFALRNYLEHVIDSESIDSIFVLQTDAARTHTSEKFDVDYQLALTNSNSLEEYYTSLLEIFYIKLNQIAEQYKIKVHMIGGSTDLDTDILSLYNNLIPCCTSWIGLIDSAHKTSKIPLILNPSLLTDAKKNNRLDLVNSIIDYSDKNFLEAQKLMESEYFGPSFGDFHPSRKGHEVLSNYIKDYLKNRTSK